MLLGKLNKDACDGDRYIDNDNWMVVDDRIFEIITEEEIDSGFDIAIATKDDNDVISYILRWYNGGCCQEEMFADAIKNIN